MAKNEKQDFFERFGRLEKNVGELQENVKNMKPSLLEEIGKMFSDNKSTNGKEKEDDKDDSESDDSGSFFDFLR